jgi:hypothetical protein
MTIGFPFGVGALSSLNNGVGDLEIWWTLDRLSVSRAFGKADRTAASGAKRTFAWPSIDVRAWMQHQLKG